MATDMNEAALMHARTGIYRERALRAVPDKVKARFFEPMGQGTFRVKEDLRAQVQFARVNLVTDAFPDRAAGLAAFDLVLCRNVLIYVHPRHLSAVLRKLTSTLNSCGALVVASTEYMTAQHVPELHEFKQGILLRGRFRP